MFEIIVEVVKTLLKEVLLKPIKFIRNPIKSLKRKMHPIKNLKRSFIRKKKLEERIEKATWSSSHKEKIGRIMKKARLVEQLTQTQAEILRGKSSATVETPEIALDINRTAGLLRTKNKQARDSIEKSLNEELKKLGVGSDKEINDIVNGDVEAGKVYEKAFEKSFDTFMTNWKNGFFAYDPEDLGMSEDERDAVWQEITETHDYSWFINHKTDMENTWGLGRGKKDMTPQVIKL